MTVSAINTTTAANSATAASSASQTVNGTVNSINYNEFLSLLVAQLKNQDPSNPTDPTQFVSQLASFSAVEQQLATNAKLDSLLTQSSISQAGSLIGKTVTSSDGKTSGKVASVVISSSGQQATLTTGQTISLGSGIKIS
jgi:flagellar basal-body rod modification protein FlgD